MTSSKAAQNKKTLAEKRKEVREKKSTRVWFMILLLVILGVMYFIGGKMKMLVLGLAIVVLTALGLEVFDYDLDLATLWDTGSIEQSRVQHTDKGVTLYGQCVSDDVNCADFSTQDDAQAKYDYCVDQILEKNPNVENVNELDIYGLDGNKNGIVCEALPALAQ